MSKKIVLKNVRASYANIYTPKAFEGQDPKYSCTLIIAKDDLQAEVLKKAILEVAREKWGDKIKGDKLPSKYKSPLHDGDDEADEHPEYEGCYYLRSNSKDAPYLCDRQKRAVSKDNPAIYSGCYVNASVNLYTFDVDVNRGVGCGLNGLQFFADGEAFGHGSAAGDFDELDEDEDFSDLGLS